MKRALILGLLLFGMNAQAHIGKSDNKLELEKKAVYFEIKAQLAAGVITLEEAQRLWKIKVKHLRKEEAK
jgi:hypothetical protein